MASRRGGRPRRNPVVLSMVAVVVTALVAGVVAILIASGGGSKGTIVGTTTGHRTGVLTPTGDDGSGTAGSDTSTSTPSSTDGSTTTSPSITIPGGPGTVPTHPPTPPPTRPPTTPPTHRTTTTTTGGGPSNPPVAAADPDNRGLYLVDAGTGAIHPVVLDYTFGRISFSPDGQQIAFDGRAGDAAPNGAVPTHMWIINRDGSGMHEVATGTVYPQGPSWSPDGRSIAYYGQPYNARGDRSLYMLNVATGSSRFLGYVDQGSGALEWSPDGRQIAAAAPITRPSSSSTQQPGCSPRRRCQPSR